MTTTQEYASIAELESKTREDLQEIAKDLGVSGTSALISRS